MGLIAGLGLLVIGVTGSLLVFAKELETFFNPQFMRVEKVTNERLPMDTLLASANRALPDYEITGWLPRHEHPHWADVIYMIRRGTDEWKVGTVDQFTGNLVASPRDLDATLTGWLLELHYKFFADHTGMLITAALAVVLCLSGITGVWLYRDFWKSIFRLRWRASARIFFSDLHKMIGITSVAFNLLLGFTGAYWNFTHVIGEWISGEHEQPKLSNRLYAGAISLEALIVEGENRLPGFRANYISLPNEPKAPITLWGAFTPHNPLRSPYGSTVVFDAQTGAFQTATDIRAQGWWTQAVDAFEPLHFGTFGGLPVKILWFFGGLTPGLLAISGSLIWWKRRL